jgi:hypothetical protein
MRRADVENWVLQIVDAVRNKKPGEDSRVELKAEWPKPDHKIARKLAGLANAARLEPVVMVIGLDESTGEIKSADKREVANWWPQVEKFFNGPAPELIWTDNVHYGEDGAVLVALLFDTTRAPFVVTIPGGTAYDRDVPWRVGNRTQSATREQLLRVLVAAGRAPHLEVLHFEAGPRPHALAMIGAPGPHLRLEIVFYITPRTAGPLVLPFHRASGAIRWGEQDLEFFDINFHNPSPSLRVTMSELCVDGPGSAELHALAPFPSDLSPSIAPEFSVTLRTSDGDDLVMRGCASVHGQRAGADVWLSGST